MGIFRKKPTRTIKPARMAIKVENGFFTADLPV
jgi:hypothetical protein